MKIQKKKAFTLAEVLITLGIIGIVAALTIPALMHNHQARVLDTQYKKAISVLANGIRLMMAREDAYGDLRLTQMQECYELAEESDAGADACFAEVVSKYFIPMQTTQDAGFAQKLRQLQYIRSYVPSTIETVFMPPAYANDNYAVWQEVTYAFQTKDGAIIGFGDTYGSEDTYNVYPLSLDLNGMRGSNRVYKDLVLIELLSNGDIIVKTADGLYKAMDWLPSTGYKYANKDNGNSTVAQCSSFDDATACVEHGGTVSLSKTRCMCPNIIETN